MNRLILVTIFRAVLLITVVQASVFMFVDTCASVICAVIDARTGVEVGVSVLVVSSKALDLLVSRSVGIETSVPCVVFEVVAVVVRGLTE